MIPTLTAHRPARLEPCADAAHGAERTGVTPVAVRPVEPGSHVQHDDECPTRGHGPCLGSCKPLGGAL